MVLWVLAIDIGKKKTGLAVGQNITGLAKPLAQIKTPVEKLQADDFKKYIQEWHIAAIVIGLPSLADGKAHPLQAEIQRIGRNLHTQFNLPVHYVDEMLSSHEARQRFGKREEYDSAAAAVMLESFLSDNNYRI